MTPKEVSDEIKKLLDPKNKQDFNKFCQEMGVYFESFLMKLHKQRNQIEKQIMKKKYEEITHQIKVKENEIKRLRRKLPKELK